MNFLTLHRDESRYSYFAENSRAAPFYDVRLRAWVVTDPGHSEHLLSMPSLLVVDCVEAYESLERSGPLLFPNLKFACAHLSLALNGAEHRNARREIAELIGTRRNATIAALPKMLPEMFGVLDQPGEVDLIGEVISPFVARLMTVMSDLDPSDASSIGGLSTVFDRMLGPKKRAMLEHQMGALRAILRRRRPDLSESEEGYRLALLILGNDALVGTIGESLCRILAADPRSRFGDIDYPSSPPEPGVSITERFASQPFEFAGIQFKPGDRFRFLFQALAYSDHPAERVRIFGFGARTCLGRALALEVWKDLTSFLSRLRTRQELISFSPRTGNYAFTCPERALVRLSL